VELGMNGADGPVLDATPGYIKSIPIEIAMQPDVLVAYEMNGAPLPHFNGFPARIIVPGWTGTYWMKHIAELEIRSKPVDSFWMQKAYRVPTGMFPVKHPFTTQGNDQTQPITEIVVNSMVTNLAEGAKVAASGFDVQGIAWDSGSGIRTVETSLDGGRTWKPATLAQDLGNYAFRPWTAHVQGAGSVKVMVRATSNAGATQPEKLLFNPAGYHHNVIQTLTLVAA
jgi:hypothetical protein